MNTSTATCFRITILALATVCLLSGCATLNEAECKQGDWIQIGYTDGAAGKPEEQLAKHREACARYQISPILNQWRIGYQKGLISYCTPEKGYQEGLNGKTYHGVCPPETSKSFRHAYDRGHRIYEQSRAVNQLQDRLDKLERQTSRLRQQGREIETQLNNPALTEAQQYILLRQLRDIDHDIDDIRDDKRQLEFELQRERDKLRQVKQLNALKAADFGKPLGGS